MEEMYEVLKFIEHGAHCRQSMDCVQGTLLISCLRGNPEIKKNILFEWFRQLALCLEQFHRCRNGRAYRYLSPYSVVVSEEGLLLLDLDSPENEFAIKRMQHRAVRTRFILPVQAGEQAAEADMFGLGRIIQLMLACFRVVPPLTGREEMRLFRLTERCTSVSGKRYEDFRQVLKDLPEASPVSEGRKRADISEDGKFWGRSGQETARGHRRGTAVLAGILALALAGGIAVGFFIEDDQDSASAGPTEENEVSAAEAGLHQQPTVEERETLSIENEEEKVFCMEMAERAVQAWMLENTTVGNQAVINYGCELERSVLFSLAAVYEREEMTEEAILAYERLIEIEDQKEKIENAGIKKMRLEAGRGQYAQALLTGDMVVKKIGTSQQVEGLMDEYRRVQNGEGETDEQSKETQE